jgi:SAM-dependent methyltransferase
VAVTGGRRWELTEAERELVSSARRGHYGVRELIAAVRERPSLAKRLVRVAADAAQTGVRTDHELANVLLQRRVRSVVPDAATGAVWRGERFFVEVLLRTLPENSDVLEIGCGAGRIARHVAPAARTLIGVDIAQTMVDEARENLAGQPNVELHKVSGFALDPIADESVDVVYSHDVFCLLEPIEALAALDATRRVLRPGGVSVISFYAFDCPAWREGQLDAARSGSHTGRFGANLPRPYTIEFIRSLHELAGFDRVTTEAAWEDDEVAAGGSVNELAHLVAVARRPG